MFISLKIIIAILASLHLSFGLNLHTDRIDLLIKEYESLDTLEYYGNRHGLVSLSNFPEKRKYETVHHLQNLVQLLDKKTNEFIYPEYLSKIPQSSLFQHKRYAFEELYKIDESLKPFLINKDDAFKYRSINQLGKIIYKLIFEYNSPLKDAQNCIYEEKNTGKIKVVIGYHCTGFIDEFDRNIRGYKKHTIYPFLFFSYNVVSSINKNNVIISNSLENMIMDRINDCLYEIRRLMFKVYRDPMVKDIDALSDILNKLLSHYISLNVDPETTMHLKKLIHMIKYKDQQSLESSLTEFFSMDANDELTLENRHCNNRKNKKITNLDHYEEYNHDSLLNGNMHLCDEMIMNNHLNLGLK